MTVCSRPEDGLGCRQGVKLPLELKLRINARCICAHAVYNLYFIFCDPHQSPVYPWYNLHAN